MLDKSEDIEVWVKCVRRACFPISNDLQSAAKIFNNRISSQNFSNHKLASKTS